MTYKNHVALSVGNYNTDYVGWGHSNNDSNVTVVSEYLTSRGFIKLDDNRYEIPEKYSQDGYEILSIKIFATIPWNQYRVHKLRNVTDLLAQAIASGVLTDRMKKQMDEYLLQIASTSTIKQ